MNHLLLTLPLFLLCTGIDAKPLPVVTAHSRSVDVRDGDHFYKGRWNVSPEVKPDNYVVDKGGGARQVTFYTDLDSISFPVAPGSSYDFIILLNGNDSAYTRVTTIDPAALAYQRQGAGPVAIPFTFGRGDKIHIRGSINGSQLLDLMFDTGSDQVVISKAGLKKGVKMNFDGHSQSVGFGGTSSEKKSSRNRLDIGALHWEGVPIVSMDNADVDGIIGYNVFDGRVVQIDFDRKVMLVYDSLPRIPQGSVKMPLRFRGNLPFFKAKVMNGSQAFEDWFEYDSGSSGSLFINDESATEHGLYGSMKPLERSRRSRGMDGNPVFADQVLLPQLRIGNTVLENVPIDIEQVSHAQTLNWSIFGMDILRRFNVVLDYAHYDIYLKPNSLLTAPYHQSFPRYLIIAAGIAIALIAALCFYFRRRKHLKAKM